MKMILLKKGWVLSCALGMGALGASGNAHGQQSAKSMAALRATSAPLIKKASVRRVSPPRVEMNSQAKAPGIQTRSPLRTKTLISEGRIGGKIAAKAWRAAKTVSQPTLQPDVSIHRIETQDEQQPDWLGEEVFNATGAEQTLTSLVMPGETTLFAVRLANNGVQATTLVLTLPASSGGWTATLFDALETGAAIKPDAQRHWTTPLIEPGASLELRLEIAATLEVKSDALQTLLQAHNGVLSDAVKVTSRVQKVARVEWSFDKEIWTPVTATTVIEAEQFDTVGLRAVKSSPDEEWPESSPLGPQWLWQGTDFEVGEVWLHASEVTDALGAPVTMSYGATQLSFRIHVVKGDALFEPDIE